MIDANYTFACPLWPDSPHQCSTVLTLQRVVSVISMIGCLFIILIIWLFRAYKYPAERLILFLTIAATLQTLSYLIGDLYVDHSACQFQAFLMQYFEWATLLWVVMITVDILLAIQKRHTRNLEKIYHLVCWLVPLFWACLPFIQNSYGQAGVWCWIVRGATAMRFGTWYIPTFLVIIGLIVVYLYIYTRVYHQRNQFSGLYDADLAHEVEVMMREVKQLMAYPLIYLLLSIPPFVYRIEDAVKPNKLPSYFLLICSVLSAPAVGVLNAIAFAFYSEIQRQLTIPHLRAAFKSRCCGGEENVIHNYMVDEEEIDCTDEMAIVT